MARWATTSQAATDAAFLQISASLAATNEMTRWANDSQAATDAAFLRIAAINENTDHQATA